MHGNVREWCWDWYGKDFYKGSRVDDPAGPLEVADRVFRGGCWGNRPHGCRSADRNRFSPDYRGNSLGFRLALAQQGNKHAQGRNEKKVKRSLERR